MKNLGVIEASSVLCGFLAAWSGNRDGYLSFLEQLLRAKRLLAWQLQRVMMEFLSANLDREIDLGKEGETMPQMSFEQLR